MTEPKENLLVMEGKKYEIVFIRVIPTWGKDYLEGQYQVKCDEGIMPLRLKINQSALGNELFLDSVNLPELCLRKPTAEDCKAGFIRKKEDLEEFLGKEQIMRLIKDRLTQAEAHEGGIERIKRYGGAIRSHHYVIQIGRIEKRAGLVNMESHEQRFPCYRSGSRR